MHIIKDPEEMNRLASELNGFKSLVPTMGYLHEGHLSLIDIAKENSDHTILSLFVNPTQFGPGEDFQGYKRDFQRDASLCQERGVDVLFAPDTKDMYAPDASVFVNEQQLSMGLCGRSRPGDHFKGVLTIVAKLFNICQPNVAVFGEKDGQQLRLIQRMVRDLNYPVSIMSGPTIREPDGLAMSSRNAYLTKEERKQAICLHEALNQAEHAIRSGEKKASVILELMQKKIEAFPLAKVDYIEIVDNVTLASVKEIHSTVMIAIAVQIGTARLIDNRVISI